MIYKTQEQLDEAIRDWQQILRLRDWRVSGKIMRKAEMCIEHADAAITRCDTKKIAKIQLIDPVDFIIGVDEPWEEEHDHERSLVHELLHIHESEICDIVWDADEELHAKLKTNRERLVSALAEGFVLLRNQLRAAEELVARSPRVVREPTNGKVEVPA